MPRLWDGGFGAVEVRRVQPYQATKTYVCPGCHRDIPPATGHYVAVPELAPELRRHWHYGVLGPADPAAGRTRPAD